MEIKKLLPLGTGLIGAAMIVLFAGQGILAPVLSGMAFILIAAYQLL